MVETSVKPSPRPREPDGPIPSSEPPGSDPPSGEAERAERGPRARRILVALLAVLTVAALALGVTVAVQLGKAIERDDLRDSAVSFAERQALTLLSINSKDIDARMKDLADNSTGDFRRQLVGMQKTFGEVVRRGKVRSTGKVDASAVSEATDTKARVLLALSAEVANAGSKKPKLRHYRIIVDLKREEDRWLVGGMQFVP